MDYRCAACNAVVTGDVLAYVDHTEKHIVDLIKHDHPDWVDKDGLCKKCLEYYHAELNGSVFKDAPCVLRQRKIKKVWQVVKGIFYRNK